MAEESEAEKTEDPSQQKKDEAHNEGRVPRSQELTVAALLLGSALVLNTSGVTLATTVFNTGGDLLANVGTTPLDAGSATVMLRELGWRVVAALAAFLAAMAGVGFTITAVQARGVMSLKPVTPDFSKLNPANNGSRIFGKQSLIELGKSLGKVGLVAGVVYGVLGDAIPDALRLAQEPAVALMPMVREYTVGLLMSAGLAYLVLAGGDYLWQWWTFQQQLRMTKEEVKQEAKSQDGDPHVKSRRRQVARSYARSKMLADVPKADVVLVNPTHIAIALKYDPNVAPAPYVLAIGQRLVAERIKAAALESGVPIVQNIPVARALVKSAKVGTMIPVEFYMAVAEILAYVLRTRGTRGSWGGSATA